jgi:hypothetical protein
MRKTIAAELDADPDAVAAVLRDLERYPDWLDIVTAAEPTNAARGDAGPAWLVTLRAKVGPFARSKRLRMVRMIDDPGQLRFVRAEVDGRDHASWILDARLGDERPCSVEVELSYGGGLWSTPLEAILGSQATDAVPRLQALVT